MVGPATRSKELPCGSETILVADDDYTVRKTVKQVLESLGYVVLLAADGKEALSMLGKQEYEIDLIMLDLMMPKLSGPQVFDQMRRQEANVKILFMSGAYCRAPKHLALQTPCTSFLAKPWRLDDLATEIRQLLDNNKEASWPLAGEVEEVTGE